MALRNGVLGTCTKQLPDLASHLQPVFARSSITKTRNRITIPAIFSGSHAPAWESIPFVIYPSSYTFTFPRRSVGMRYIGNRTVVFYGSILSWLQAQYRWSDLLQRYRDHCNRNATMGKAVVEKRCFPVLWINPE